MLGLSMQGPAVAQSAASSIDQPTPATLSHGASSGEGHRTPRDRPAGRVAPPSAIQSSTDAMQSGSSIQGTDQGGKTDPIKHLPKDMR